MMLILCFSSNKVIIIIQVPPQLFAFVCILHDQSSEVSENCLLTFSPPISVRTQPGCSEENRISSFFSSSAAHAVNMFRLTCEEREENEGTKEKNSDRAIEEMGERFHSMHVR